MTAKLKPISDQLDYVDRILVLLPSSSLRQHKDDINPNVGTLPGMVNRVVLHFQPVVVELVFISPIILLELDFFCYCFVVWTESVTMWPWSGVSVTWQIPANDMGDNLKSSPSLIAKPSGQPWTPYDVPFKSINVR